MTEITKCQGIVLKKVNYGDTSLIVTFFTDEYGKITGIKKGARSKLSKTGNILDYLNVLQLVLYKKETRDVQIISQASLVKHFPRIKNELETYKYALAVIELLERFSVEEEKHERLYKGTIRILDLMNSPNENPLVLFVKYFIFFLKEIGYDFTFDECAKCGRKIDSAPFGYNFEVGTICEKCLHDYPVDFIFSEELFTLFNELKFKDKKIEFRKYDLNKLINFFEKFLMYTHPEFKGIKSLKIY